jgi:hypothetical protein
MEEGIAVGLSLSTCKSFLMSNRKLIEQTAQKLSLQELRKVQRWLSDYIALRERMARRLADAALNDIAAFRELKSYDSWR